MKAKSKRLGRNFSEFGSIPGQVPALPPQIAKNRHWDCPNHG
jgi:hypothetical protein